MVRGVMVRPVFPSEICCWAAHVKQMGVPNEINDVLTDQWYRPVIFVPVNIAGLE